MEIIIKENALSIIDEEATQEYRNFIKEVQGKKLLVKTKVLFKDAFNVLYNKETYHVNEALVLEVLDDIRSEYYKCSMCGNCTHKSLYLSISDRCEISSCRVAGFLEDLV